MSKTSRCTIAALPGILVSILLSIPGAPALARESAGSAAAAPDKPGAIQLALVPEKCPKEDAYGRKRSCRVVYFNKNRKGKASTTAK